MTISIVVAPHPDDEVLGCTSVLLKERVIVAQVTGGVPPWVPAAEAGALRRRRRHECESAWRSLSADVAEVVDLGFSDLSAWRSVPGLTDALCDLVVRFDAPTVYVPSYQRGHPDHDATYVSALRARALLADHPVIWRVYGLYGYGADGELHFGQLDRRHFPDARHGLEGSEAMAGKSAALTCFRSQLRPDSIVQRWLNRPESESLADLPAVGSLPPGDCFYEREFDFSRHGVHVHDVDATLALLLPPGQV